MVKIRAFDGFTFKPELYGQILNKNMEYMEDCQLFHGFNSLDFIDKGLLNAENNEFLYLYQQQFLGFVTLGLLAQLSLIQYSQKKIKKHQKTLIRPHLNQQTYYKNHVGPVIVGHQHLQIIDAILHELKNSIQPFAIWETIDGRKHKLWRISSFQSLIQYFESIPSLYILDGHHRFQAALAYLQKIGQNASQKNKWIQGLVYSTKYIRTYPQFRKLIHEQNRSIIRGLLTNEKLIINQLNQFNPNDHQLDLVLLQDGKFFQIKEVEDFGRPSEKNGVQKLDKILKQQLQKLQNKTHQPIKFIPSIMFDFSNLETHTHPVFFVKSPSINSIFEIADQDQFLPPKSTWLEPKPCLHMVIRLPY